MPEPPKYLLNDPELRQFRADVTAISASLCRLKTEYPGLADDLDVASLIDTADVQILAVETALAEQLLLDAEQEQPSHELN